MTVTGVEYDNIVSYNFQRHRKLFVPLERLLSFDYVRENLYHCSNPVMEVEKKRRPIFGEQHGGIIAYATVGRLQAHLFTCLVWWHKPHDRDVQPNGVYGLSPEHKNDPAFKHWGPCEAVAPSRVLEFFPEYREA